MKKIFWVFNLIIRPSNVRETINVIVFLISISLVFISFSLLSSGVLADVVRTIGASGTATTVIQYINQTTERVEKSQERDRFSTLFSCDNDSKVSISFLLPAFKIQVLTEKEQELNSADWKQFALQNLSLKPTQGAITNDVKAASYIISAYSKIFSRNNSLSLPEIKWDEDFTEEFFFPRSIDTNKNSKEVCFLIGFSNRIFVCLNNRNIENRYFYIEKNRSKIIQNKIYIGYFSDNELVFQKNWNSETIITKLGTGIPEGNYDYGILAKLNLGNKTILICAGITEIGTLKLAEYVTNNWELVYRKLKNEKENRTLKADEAFTVLFKIPVRPESRENVTISRICIKKWL